MKRTFTYFISFILFIPPLVFFTDLTRNPYYFQIVLLNAATTALFLVWLHRGLREKSLLLKKTPLDLPLWSFFALASLSWVLVLFENLAHPYLGYSVFSEGFKRWLFLLVNVILVYYLAVNFVDDTNRRRFLSIVTGAGCVAAVYGILQYFGIELIWPKVLNPFGGRSVSTFGNPNFLSSYLIMVFPLLYVFFLQAKMLSRRLFYLLLMFIFFASLLGTMTRSSWLGLAAAMTLLVALLFLHERDFFRKNRKAVLLPLAALAVLAVVWPQSRVAGYSPSVIERITEVKEATTTYYGAWHQRRLIWSCAWYMVVERPFLGKGWGCFELFFPFYQGRHLFLDAYRNFRTHANNTHNEVLEIWSQTGTIGFGVYLWLLVTIGAYALFLLKNLTGEKKLLAAALSASLVAMWVDNLLNVSLHFAVPGFLYWWNVGLLAGLGRSEDIALDLKSPGRRLMIWVLIALGALLILRYSRHFLGEVNYFKGFKASKSNDIPRAIPLLEKAHAYQRLEVNNNYELANCYARSNMREKATWAYGEALRANAGYDEIYFNRATVLVQGGKTGQAVAEYTRSLYINPMSPESYAALGSLFLQDPDRYGNAGISLFEQSLVFFPRNRDIWNNLGYLYTKKGDNLRASQAYRRALEIDPDFELARRNLKVTLDRLGTPDTSLEMADRLVGEVEKHIIAKNWTAALRSCERLVQLLPGSFKARLYMANIYFTVGRVNDAIGHYQEAVRLEPDNAAAVGNLGLAYLESGQYAPARREFERLLALDPANALARQKITEIAAIQSGKK